MYTGKDSYVCLDTPLPCASCFPSSKCIKKSTYSLYSTFCTFYSHVLRTLTPHMDKSLEAYLTLDFLTHTVWNKNKLKFTCTVHPLCMPPSMWNTCLEPAVSQEFQHCIEGHTGVFSWCVIRWFYFPWSMNLENYYNS